MRQLLRDCPEVVLSNACPGSLGFALAGACIARAGRSRAACGLQPERVQVCRSFISTRRVQTVAAALSGVPGGSASASPALSGCFRFVVGATHNPSVNATPNGVRLGARGRSVYHQPRAPRHTPPGSRYLKR